MTSPRLTVHSCVWRCLVAKSFRGKIPFAVTNMPDNLASDSVDPADRPTKYLGIAVIAIIIAVVAMRNLSESGFVEIEERLMLPVAERKVGEIESKFGEIYIGWPLRIVRFESISLVVVPGQQPNSIAWIVFAALTDFAIACWLSRAAIHCFGKYWKVLGIKSTAAMILTPPLTIFLVFLSCNYYFSYAMGIGAGGQSLWKAIEIIHAMCIFSAIFLLIGALTKTAD